MSIEITIIVTIISASLALASLIITGQNGLRREMREQRIEIQGQRKEMQEQGVRLGKEMKEQGEKHSNEITEVKLEVAALKATVETYFRVRVDPPMQAAVAEGPEDYGAD